MATRKVEFVAEKTVTQGVPTMSMEQFAALITESLAPTPKVKKPQSKR